MHYRLVLNILRYLAGSKTLGIVYSAIGNPCAYTDAEWAKDLTERKSTSGYVFCIGSTAFSWRTKKKSVVAASSLEAEYIAQTFCPKEALWLRSILVELNILRHKDPFVIYADNPGAITLAQEERVTPRTKHIGVCYHLTRDYVQKGLIALFYCNTSDMIADGMTKILVGVSFLKFCKDLGLK